MENHRIFFRSQHASHGTKWTSNNAFKQIYHSYVKFPEGIPDGIPLTYLNIGWLTTV